MEAQVIMGLPETYVVSHGQIKDVLAKIQEGQAPKLFNREHLKDLGFTSSNIRAVIPLLKALGFLTAEGAPTARYMDYLDKSRARRVLGHAVKEAYADIFVIKAKPAKDDRAAIEGKFRSVHNVSENVAGLMAGTFFSLLELSDLDPEPAAIPPSPKPPTPDIPLPPPAPAGTRDVQFAYNIQIHLPATKDVEVYNAIFKSLKEHLID